MAVIALVLEVPTSGPSDANAAEDSAGASTDPADLLGLLEKVEAKDWEAAVPGLRAAADTVEGPWIAEVSAGLAYAALAQDDPAGAWHELELGRLRYLAWLTGFPQEADAHSPIALETARILLSGSHATLLAFGDSRILAPLCMVVHADGEHAFAIESGRVRAALDRGPGAEILDHETIAILEDLIGAPWSRVPPTTRRIFVQPPVALWNLPFAEAPIPALGDEVSPTLGDRYPISYLPWSTVLSWASAPRTRSGDGLAILGGRDDDSLRDVLGGRPRNAPIAATTENLGTTASDADMIHFRGRPARLESGAATALRLDDADLDPVGIASLEYLADVVLLEPGRYTGDIGVIVCAFLAGGVRSVLALDRSLADSTADAVVHDLYLRLRAGTPRDRAVGEVYSAFEEQGHPLGPNALRVWGPGHLPVYALTAKRGIGTLLLSWVLFLGTGFFLLRFFVRRFIQLDPEDRT